MMHRRLVAIRGTSATHLVRNSWLTSTTLTSTRMQSNNNSAEDKAELDRERQLRERFEALKKGAPGSGFFAKMRNQMEEMRKQQEQMRNNAGGSNNAGGNTGGASQQVPFALQMFYTVTLYTTAFYAVLLVYQSSQPESMLSTMQGEPWWATPKETVAVALLTRIVHSLSVQRELRSGLEAHNKYNPRDSIDQYVLRTRPDLLSGHTCSAYEVVDVVGRALRGAGTACTKTITAAASTTRDQRAAFDAIVSALRRDYPMYCPPPMPPGPYGQPPQMLR